MNRKQMLKLLNGIKSGNLPVSAVFDDWPEKQFFTIPGDDEHYENDNGEVISYLEVDAEAMNYPKVKIICREPEDEDVKISIDHKYIDYPECAYRPVEKNDTYHADIETIESKPPPMPELPFHEPEEYKPPPLYCIR